MGQLVWIKDRLVNLSHVLEIGVGKYDGSEIEIRYSTATVVIKCDSPEEASELIAFLRDDD